MGNPSFILCDPQGKCLWLCIQNGSVPKHLLIIRSPHPPPGWQYLKHTPKSYCFKYCCYLSFSCTFPPLILQDTQHSQSKCPLCNIYIYIYIYIHRYIYSFPNKEVGHRVNLFYLSVSAFHRGTIVLKIIFSCLSLHTFRFPKIKVWILNPISVSSSILPSLTPQIIPQHFLTFLLSTVLCSSFAIPREHYL